MKKKTIKTLVMTLVLGVMICFTAVSSSLLNSKSVLPTRDIDVDSIGTLSYNEKVEEILNNFSDYSYNTDDDLVEFVAEQELDAETASKLDFVSSTEHPVIKKFITILDAENEKFYITTEYVQNGQVLNTETIETQPRYDEATDDYFLVMPDGSEASLKELLMQDNLDECIAITATAATASAAILLLAATVVVLAPTVVTVVDVVVQTIVTWFRSIFRWFKRLFSRTTTVVTTTTTTVLTPSISISGTQVKTKELTKDAVNTLDMTAYYLCFADPTNGKMYISVGKITYDEALMIMSVPILVPCIGNSKKDMVASVFAFSEMYAFNIASAAGIAKPYPEIHGGGKPGYYYHYHSAVEVLTRQGDLARPHAFFSKFI